MGRDPRKPESRRLWQVQDVTVDLARGCVVGVSGGIDSMVLLHRLHVLLEQGDTSVPRVVVHLNYQRRRGAAGDAALVQATARRLGWRCVVRRVRPAPAGVNFQAWAREVRYRTMATVARRYRIPLVCVAHTQDDQAETVLAHLLRGTGWRGVAGMATEQPFGPGITLRRPLLICPRTAIVAYARRHRVPFREDPSNRTSQYTRNRLRHEVLPCCERIAPGAGRHLAATARHLRDLADWVEAAVDAAWPSLKVRRIADGLRWRRAAVVDLPLPLRVRIYQRIYARLGTVGMLNDDQLERLHYLTDRGAGSYRLPGAVEFTSGSTCRLHMRQELRRPRRRGTKPPKESL